MLIESIGLEAMFGADIPYETVISTGFLDSMKLYTKIPASRRTKRPTMLPSEIRPIFMPFLTFLFVLTVSASFFGHSGGL